MSTIINLLKNMFYLFNEFTVVPMIQDPLPMIQDPLPPI